jgi:hypothetical protein
MNLPERFQSGMAHFLKSQLNIDPEKIETAVNAFAGAMQEIQANLHAIHREQREQRALLERIIGGMSHGAPNGSGRQADRVGEPDFGVGDEGDEPRKFS